MKSLAEFAALAAKKMKFMFGRGVYLDKHTSQSASVEFGQRPNYARGRLEFCPEKSKGLFRTRLRLEDGRTLRLLSAMEVLEARREAEILGRDGKERALCSNACLLARALERRGRPVFQNGEAVLNALRVEEIETLAERWGRFNREENPSVLHGERVASALKKAWSTRRMSG